MMPQAALGPSVRNLIMKYTERKTNRVKGPLDHSSYLLIAGYLSRELTLSLLCHLTLSGQIRAVFTAPCLNMQLLLI